jgi:general secretion pathway protein C
MVRIPRLPVLRFDGLLDEQTESFARLLAESLQGLLEGEMTEFLGALAGERTRARTGRRAGHRARDLDTCAGRLELREPRDRARRFAAGLFDRYASEEKMFIAALAEMHVAGVTTARVKAVAEALCGHTLHERAVGQVRQALDDALSHFARRTTQGTWPCVLLHAERRRVLVDRVVRTRVVRMAIGVDRQGRSAWLGADLLADQRTAGRKGELRSLKRRALDRVRLVVVDGHAEKAQKARAARGTLDPGWLRACEGALAMRRAVEPRAARGSRRPWRPPSQDPRPRWRVAKPDGREASAAPSAVLQQGLAHDSCEDSEAGTRPTDAATARLARHPVMADATASRQDGPSLHGPRSGASSRAALYVDRRGFVARATDLISPSTVWTAAGAALVVACVWFWNVAAPDTPPDAVVGESTRGYSEPILASPAPAPGLRPSVPSSAVTLQRSAVSRYQLSGVLAAATAGGPGIALIAVDGGAARAVRVGAPVDGDLVLKGVSQGGATLGPANGPATLMLEVNYGAAPPSPIQMASALRAPAAFGAQASLSVDADPAALPAWMNAAYPQGLPRSAGAMQPVVPTADDLAAQPATDLPPDASQTGEANPARQPWRRRARLPR